MSTEENQKKRPHIADGIEEYDNPMPRWWIGLFYFTIVFAVIYLFVFHMGSGPSLNDEYANDMKELAQQQTKASVHSEGTASGAPASLAERLKAKEAQVLGNEIYKTNCVPCHGDQGQGGIGPNLTDGFWIHGGKDEDIVRSITIGVVDKGMPPWGSILGNEKVEAVAAYIISIQGTNPPNAKAPQGEKFERPNP